jgi:hypothetical protein
MNSFCIRVRMQRMLVPAPQRYPYDCPVVLPGSSVQVQVYTVILTSNIRYYNHRGLLL